MEEQDNIIINENSISAELMLRSFAVEESINGVAFANAEGVLSYVNKSFLKLWRLNDATEILGKSAFSLFKSPNEAQTVAGLVLTKGEWDGEITAIRNDNSEFIVKFSAKMLNDGNSPVTLMASFVDITDLKKSEEAIKENETLLRSVLETLPVGVYLADKNGKFIYTNRRGREIWGGIPDSQSLEDFDRVKVRSFKTGQLLQSKELGIYRALIEGETTLNQELEVETGDGNLQILSCSAVPVRNEQDEIFGGVVVVEDVTQSKSDFRTIQKTNKEYQEIIDALDQSSLVSITDPRGNILKVNKRFCQVARYEEHELLGKNHNIISSGYHDKTFWLDFWQTITKGEVWRGEIKNKAKDGTEYWVDTVINPIHDENGRVTHFLSIRQDITNRKNYESLLETKNVELKEITDALDQSSLVSITDIKGTILKVNKRFCEIARYEEHELLGKNHSIISSGYHDKEFWKDFWQTISNGEVWRGEIKNTAKDGTNYWVDTVINPIRNEYGRVTHFLSIRQDITNRKEYESLLETKNVELNEIIDALDESSLVSITGPKGTILKVNKRFCQVARYEEHELIGKNHSIISSGHHDKAFWKDFWQTISKGEVWRGEIKNRAKDGTYYWVDTVINPIRNEYGRVTHFLSIRQDITDRKNFESQLLQTNLRLAHIEQFVDLTMDAILVTNEQGYLVYINKVASERLGIPQQECADFNIIDFEVLFKERANWSTFVEGLKKIDSINGERVYFNKKTGKVFPVDVTARHVFIQDKGYTIAVARDISELKKGEMELRESKERLAEAQRISKLGYWEQSLITNTIWWSDMQYEIFGVGRSETPKTNDDFIKLIHPEDHKKFIKILNGKLSDSVENYRIVRPDGEVRVVHAVAQITYNERGVPIKLSGVNQDITERIKVDNALRESELTLRRAQRIAKIGSWKLDIESNVTEWSEETFKIFNVPMDKRPLTPYEHFYGYVHPEDKDYVYNSWRAAIDNKVAKYDIIHRIIVDNTIKWVTEQTEFTYDSLKLVKVFGTVQDITDQMFLRDANVIFNQSQSLAGIGSWRFSIRSKELFWSDSVYTLFGIDKETTVASNDVYLNAIYYEDRPRVLSESMQTFNKNATFDIEYRVQLPSGELRWIYEKGNVLVDHNGEAIEMYGIVREITSEKDKTEELIKARKQAEEASLVKDEFLSVMSHEIRTPLNSVIGLSNLLLRRSPREDQLAIMKTLKGSADNLMHLVNDVLDYNKIRAGKLELEAIPFSLNKFLQHLHATFSISAQDKGLDFLIHEDPRVPDELIGDVGRLNQIFNNLLNNAIKFTNLGYVKLEVQLKQAIADSCTILFQVMDTGVGIPADKLTSVFIPFQQSERSTSRIYGGTGLGLSIVKTLVDIMGGKLNVSSKEEVGTVFNLEFEFPFSSTEESKVRLPEQNPVVPRKEIIRSKKLKILYVEDVESNRFLIKNLLSDFSINCQTASSGQAALRLTSKSKFDLILMDIQMPKMDGYQATERIRKQTGGKNCKTNIIAFTAEPYSEELKQKIAGHKIQDVVTKPFDTNKLIDKISQLTEASARFFSFSFYERAFGDDPKQLRLIKRTVMKDLKKFEVGLSKYHIAANLKGIRSEVHKMRPIIKNLECYALYELLDQYKWPEEQYTREAALTLKEIVKLTKRLLQKIEKLKI